MNAHRLRAAALVATMSLLAGCAGPLASSARPAETQSPHSADAAAEPRVTPVQVPSAALGRSQSALVYLPPGYDRSSRRLPVLYLFHGQLAGPADMAGFGFFERATALIRAGGIDPLIIVAPDLGNSFGVNNPRTETVEVPNFGPVRYDGGRYEDFLVGDLPAFVDATYRTVADRNGRFVGGVSMGGFAALHLAFRHPDRYSRVGAHSPALVSHDFRWLYPNRTTIADRDPVALASRRDLAGLSVYLDCGTEDEWGFTGPTRRLGAALKGRTGQLGLKLRPGTHQSSYWSAHVDEYLRFYAEAR